MRLCALRQARLAFLDGYIRTGEHRCSEWLFRERVFGLACSGDLTRGNGDGPQA